MSNAGIQFTIRQLFAAVALLCITLALAALEPRASLYIAAGVIGIATLTFGIFRRQRSTIIAGVVLAIVSSGFLAYHSSLVRVWVGYSKLPVHVLVIDTDTFVPIDGAKIEIFTGPFSPLEGPFLGKRMPTFTPSPTEPGVGKLSTNAHGECEFTHAFFAAGGDGLYGDSGYIRTSGYWLKATAPGYGSVMMPMDGQSGKSRDIHDRSPLCITVPLRKNGCD